jgi:hypothetical protein
MNTIGLVMLTKKILRYFFVAAMIIVPVFCGWLSAHSGGDKASMFAYGLFMWGILADLALIAGALIVIIIVDKVWSLLCLTRINWFSEVREAWKYHTIFLE